MVMVQATERGDAICVRALLSLFLLCHAGGSDPRPFLRVGKLCGYGSDQTCCLSRLQLRGGSGSPPQTSTEVIDIDREDSEICLEAVKKDIFDTSSSDATPPTASDSDNSKEVVVVRNEDQRFEEFNYSKYNEFDDPILNPPVQYFLTRCPGGKPDLGCYYGSCRFFFARLGDEAWTGEVDMATLRMCFEAMKCAELVMEPGMFNMCMFMVAGRAHQGDADFADGLAILEWIHEVNRTEGGLDWGLDRPKRMNGHDIEAMIHERLNYSSNEERLRDYHPWSDYAGNTLRSSMFEACVAGAAKHGKGTLKDAQRVLDEMMEYGVEPDLGTYSQLLLTVASLANIGRACMQDANAIMERMMEEGIKPCTITYGSWCAVVASCAGRDEGVTWRDGEAILEIVFRLGIRPDSQLFCNIMEAAANQAARGVATPWSPGEYVYDPVRDAEYILKLIDRVFPRMYPRICFLDQYINLVKAAAKEDKAGMKEGRRILEILQEVDDSLCHIEDGTVRLRSDCWDDTPKDLGPDLGFFNSYLELVQFCFNRGDANLTDVLQPVMQLKNWSLDGDLKTKNILKQILSKQEASCASCNKHSCYLHSSHVKQIQNQMEAMNDLPFEVTFLRYERKCKREPYIQSIPGVRFRYDEDPPECLTTDIWDGLKAIN